MSIKAVISVAGFGTRFFPLTKAVSKCMLPIGNRPVIDYLVGELILAGVKEILFVTLPGDEQVRRYFMELGWMREFFERRGWLAKYSPIAELSKRLRGIEFHWMEQPMDSRYGTAVPAMIAREWVGSSDWLLLSGDDLVLRSDGGSDLDDLIKARALAATPAAIQVARVPRERLARYGVVKTRRQGDWLLLDGAVEKPKVEDAPSDLVSISRFLLRSDFFEVLDTIIPDSLSGEYMSISALIRYARQKAVLIHEISGQYHDCGQPEGWLAANVAAAELRGLSPAG